MRGYAPPFSSPGTLIIDPSSPRPALRVLAYGPEGFHEAAAESVGQACELLGRWPVTWLNVDGLGDEAVLREIGQRFELHRLALEDVVNTHQRAKVEQYDKHLFIVLRMALIADHLETEQLSLFLGKGFVLTFQEGHPGDCFDPVRQRIRKGGGRLRSAGSDYLAYALLDGVIDAYFPILEAYGEALEHLEDDLLVRPDEELVARIHEVKRDLLTLRRAIWPLRDAIGALLREENPLVRPETVPYLRDCYDHTVQIVDLVETYRELASGFMDVYLSSVSNRMNEIMKVLTVISTIFIPLTFIAGIYGMNFNPQASPLNMPELNWPWGYPFSLLLMAGVAVALLVFFRRKGWLGKKVWVPPPLGRQTDQRH
jgi:magnesium transporter